VNCLGCGSAASGPRIGVQLPPAVRRLHGSCATQDGYFADPSNRVRASRFLPRRRDARAALSPRNRSLGGWQTGSLSISGTEPKGAIRTRHAVVEPAHQHLRTNDWRCTLERRVASGLPNIWLVKGYTVKDTPYGKGVSISDPGGHPEPSANAPWTRTTLLASASAARLKATPRIVTMTKTGAFMRNSQSQYGCHQKRSTSISACANA
jgi:hypothetical protein